MLFRSRVEYERNSALKFFSLFLSLFHPVLDRNIAGKRFFNFLNFFAVFFRNFLALFEYERNSVLKFFSLVLDLSHPVLAKSNTGKRFFIILNFFAFFSEIFLLGSSMNGIQD